MPDVTQARELRGKYEILGHIARGGMAELQLARATGIEGFEKLLVIKRILPHLAANREFVTMFLDEARIAATLHHPNIVQVYDIGSLDGDYFFTMEYLHGEDVRHIFKAARAADREIPLEHALSIILGVCAALHHAHGAVGVDGAHGGIIHRDVSPQNVFVTFEGGVKLVDFGIAKAARRLTETREGTLKGKVQYMSPEQCLQAPLDPRSDVFAVAIMLWELSVGRQLFDQGSEFEILKAIVERDAPAPRQIKANYPEALAGIVMKGLQRNREARYQSAQAMQADLEEFAREHRLAVSPIGLQRYMKDMFGDRVSALVAARQSGDQALVEHLVQAIDQRTSLSVSGAPRNTMSTAPRATRALEAPTVRAPWRTLALVTVLLALGAASLVYRARRHVVFPAVAPTPIAMAVPLSVEQPVPPTAPKTIVVALRKDPVEASVTLDGARLIDDWVRFSDDGRSHLVQVSAPGYVAQRMQLDARSERTLYVFLKRANVPVAASKTSAEHKRRPEHVPAQAPAVTKPKPVMPALDP